MKNMVFDKWIDASKNKRSYQADFLVNRVMAELYSTEYLCQNAKRIQELLKMLMVKDECTYRHSKDVYCIVNNFYEILPVKTKARLDKGKLLTTALLHDIGKIIIPTEILNKPKSLNSSERKIINTHAFSGKMVLDFYGLCDISNFVCYHHERIDGKGYLGLLDREIPIESKIVSIADTFSALTTDRPYQKARSLQQANEIIKEVSGFQLDDELSQLFCGGKLKEFAI